MPQFDTKFTVGFAAAVCGVCSVFVAGSVVALKERQEENKVLDRQSKVLIVAGLMQEGEPLPRDEIKKRYAESVEPVVVELKTGKPVEGVDPSTFDQAAEMADPATSEEAPDNPAKVRRLPKRGMPGGGSAGSAASCPLSARPWRSNGAARSGGFGSGPATPVRS